MDMRVMVQGLAPSVKDCNEADLGTEMLWVGRDCAQRLSRGLEQDGVDRSLVLERDRGDGRGKREDDMEIGYRQELRLPDSEPFGSCLPLALRVALVQGGGSSPPQALMSARIGRGSTVRLRQYGVRPCRWTASCCGFDQALGVLILKVDGTAVTKR